MGLATNALTRPDKGNKNETATPNLPERGLNLRTALMTRTFWLMVVAFATFSFANASIMQNHVPHLQDIQIPTAIAATALSAVGIGSAIGKFGFGWLCDFIQSKYTLVIGICCQITSVLILMNMKSTSSMVTIWLYAGIFGLGIGSWLPAMSLTVSNIFGMASYGVIFGMMNLIFGVGGSLGPVVAGMIYDTNQNYFWAFIMCFSLYAVSMPAILMVRRPKR
jgi:MFS family permease